MTRTTRLLPGLGLALAVVAAACSSGTAATPAATTAASDAASPVVTAAPDASATASDAASPSADAGAKVSANSASQAELVAALEAANVPNADRWAREIEEYRPYPTDDPTLQRLQDNLAKYNPDPATLAGILAALEP